MAARHNCRMRSSVAAGEAGGQVRPRATPVREGAIHYAPCRAGSVASSCAQAQSVPCEGSSAHQNQQLPPRRRDAKDTARERA